VVLTARLVAAAVFAVTTFSQAAAEPLPTLDQNPLLTDSGLSTPFASRIAPRGSTRTTLTADWSSTEAFQQSAREELVMDAETREWRLDLQHSLTDRIALRMQLPYRRVDGGSLDGFIDDWHSLFGQSEGDRPLLAKNDLLIDYRRDDALRVRIDRDTSGIGDLHTAIGYQLTSHPHYAVAIWSGFKLPTADNTMLNRNRISASMTLALERSLSSRWRAHGQASAIYARRGGVLQDMQRSWIAQGMLALDYLSSDALALTVQVDAHTAAYRDTPMELFGHAWLVTIGGRYRFESGWQVQLGVGEDIKVEASPDVNFILAISKAWRAAR
jgi:hypothetical protein